MYQEYVWKVDKIISQKRQGKHIFLYVRWKPGNRSWISLKRLRLHDPFSCVTYAVEKRLTNSPEWDWTRDFINDTIEYK